ncbi:MAG: carboxylating nicotinate-nucleotide diphosphorylase [Bacteroidia bacterium]
MNKTTGYQPKSLDLSVIQPFIAAALHEDVGDGDHTSLATIPADVMNRARLLVKDTGVLAGMELAHLIFEAVDPRLEAKTLIADGTFVTKGEIALTVEGPARSILTAERLVLNCAQRMSGIATATWNLVKLTEGTKVRLFDTRKTTPGFRYFEKWAVRIGGAHNHRYALYDMILIKDNHVDYAGGVAEAIRAAKNYLRDTNRTLDIEVEVRNMAELEIALGESGVRRIMLDNFTPENLRVAVQRIGDACESEASGGITAENIRAYAETGVGYISCGALTHSFKSLDLSLKAERK